MSTNKKKKIIEYLQEKQASQSITSFDNILTDYLSDCLKETLCQMGMNKVKIYIDWLTDYKCINIQGTVDDYYFDIQIEPLCFYIAYDKVEPDDATAFILNNEDSFYEVVNETIQKVKKS